MFKEIVMVQLGVLHFCNHILFIYNLFLLLLLFMFLFSLLFFNFLFDLLFYTLFFLLWTLLFSILLFYLFFHFFFFGLLLIVFLFFVVIDLLLCPILFDFLVHFEGFQFIYLIRYGLLLYAILSAFQLFIQFVYLVSESIIIAVLVFDILELHYLRFCQHLYIFPFYCYHIIQCIVLVLWFCAIEYFVILLHLLLHLLHLADVVLVAILTEHQSIVVYSVPQ